MKGEKSCVIQFSLAGIDVTFSGEWIRADVDRTYSAMFRELPKHTVKRRDEMVKVKKEKETLEKEALEKETLEKENEDE